MCAMLIRSMSVDELVQHIQLHFSVIMGQILFSALPGSKGRSMSSCRPMAEC
jgi:hypothetical protein